MVLNLRKIFVTDDYTIPIEYKLDLGDIDFGGVYALKKPVDIKGEVTSSAGVVALSMHITAWYCAPCDRCGLETETAIPFDIEYILATNTQNEDNDDIITVPDYQLDLDEIVRSDVLLHIPMKHLCKDDCKGICSKCGKNLNEGSCNCETKEIDPRLAALADLLK